MRVAVIVPPVESEPACPILKPVRAGRNVTHRTFGTALEIGLRPGAQTCDYGPDRTSLQERFLCRRRAATPSWRLHALPGILGALASILASTRTATCAVHGGL